jgi:hypothetical protein
MKPRLRSYDPFASLDYSQRPKTLTPLHTPSRASARDGGVDARSILERDYPHVCGRIATLWGYQEANDYFESLWLQEGERQGFVPDAMSELMLLARLHQMIVPRKAKSSLAGIYGSAYNVEAKRDPWDDTPRRR